MRTHVLRCGGIAFRWMNILTRRKFGPPTVGQMGTCMLYTQRVAGYGWTQQQMADEFIQELGGSNYLSENQPVC
ncbi:unnamed protein product [Rhodiola kirilowii]